MSDRSGAPADLSALAGLAPELAEMLVSVACDIALVLDDGGVIQSIALGGGQPVAPEGWVGKHWADTVTDDTRKKAEEFLDDVASTGSSRLRNLSHESPSGRDVPIAYTAVKLGEGGPTLAVGRDLRVVSAMQQRLVQAQADIERDYWQRRQAETRYRLLFQVSAEPVMIVDPSTFHVLDVNRAAVGVLGITAQSLIGKSLLAEVEREFIPELQGALDLARGSSRATDGYARLTRSRGNIALTITPFMAEGSSVLLIRFRPASIEDAPSRSEAVFAGLVRRTPDAIVITNSQGRVILANQSFRELVCLPEGRPLTACSLSYWVGDSEAALAPILSTVENVGPIRLLRTPLRRDDGQRIEVELSATLILDHDSVGFIMRPVSLRTNDQSQPDNGAAPDAIAS